MFNICCITREGIETDVDDICLNCPLIDLGTEDMTWDDLIEKVSKKITPKKYQINPNNESLFLENWAIWFTKNGHIIANSSGVKATVTGPTEVTLSQMWQIIKALIGN